jgi:hypothetical protein
MISKRSLIAYPIVLMGVCFMLVAGCTEKDDDGNSDVTESPVVIQGTMDASAAAATKVLAIAPNNDFKQADISGNNFSIELDNGQPWGLVFLNSSDRPIGLLSLGNGIETLPLHYLNSAIDTIDLETISRDGTAFTATGNPIGTIIPLTQDQKEIVGTMDDYLAALLKNPDVNGNGQIDVLEGKSFSLSVLYFIKPGNFKVPNLTPTLDPTTLIEGYRLSLTVEDSEYPEAVFFTGPSGSPLSTTASESYLAFDNDSRIYYTSYLFDLSGSGSYIPPGGTYTIQYGNSTLTFNLADQSYVDSNIVYPWPTVTLNADGTMNKVDWNYKFHTGTAQFDVTALVDNIMVQLSGTSPQCSAIPNQSGMYGSDRLPANTTSHTFACQNMVWGNTMPQPGMEYLERLMMTYEDHYRATYVVMYEKTY